MRSKRQPMSVTSDVAIIKDRGGQMKAKPIQRLCKHHGMPHLCSRSSTSNDNLYIELAFSTAKRAPDKKTRCKRSSFTFYLLLVEGVGTPFKANRHEAAVSNPPLAAGGGSPVALGHFTQRD